MQVREGGMVQVQIADGDVVITRGEGGILRVQAAAAFPAQTEYRVEQAGDQVLITAGTLARFGKTSVHLLVEVPPGVAVRVEAETASVTVIGLQGDVEASSVSGDILVEGVEGEIAARSNRGDVRVLDSRGRISVAGNYGLLLLEGLQGDIGAATIMGTIRFNGLVRSGDTVRLETDHGPVEAGLAPGSDFAFEVHSTSGELACMLPGAGFSGRACSGVAGYGAGSLTIRTVSGAVTLRLLP